MILSIYKSKRRSSSVGKIKIIGGKWKGRKIPIARSSEIRPTTNRIREMLFAWLNPVVSGSVCLDCFAGSGALGFESLSRGARKVTFLDKNRACVTALMTVSRSFFSYDNEIIHTDCRLWLRNSIGTYNIVFLDPPFKKNIIILEVIFLLEQYNHFKNESWIYIENSKDKDICSINSVPAHWFLYKKKITKSIACYLFQRKL